MQYKKHVAHWLKIDHITFLLILPAILLGYRALAVIFWAVALLYDVYEQRKNAF